MRNRKRLQSHSIKEMTIIIVLRCRGTADNKEMVSRGSTMMVIRICTRSYFVEYSSTIDRKLRAKGERSGKGVVEMDRSGCSDLSQEMSNGSEDPKQWFGRPHCQI